MCYINSLRFFNRKLTYIMVMFILYYFKCLILLLIHFNLDTYITHNIALFNKI